MKRVSLAAILFFTSGAFAQDPVAPATDAPVAEAPAPEAPAAPAPAEEAPKPKHRCTSEIGSRIRKNCSGTGGGITREDIENSGRSTIAPPIRTPAPAGR